MTPVVPQRHKHLPLPLTARQYVILHDGQPADVTMLVAQTLENPLGRVPLLRRPLAIFFQDPVDDANKRIQLRSRRRPDPPISGRHRERQHLRHLPRINPEPTRSLAPTDPLNLDRVADPPIQIHQLHLPALCVQRKEPSAAGLLLRRNRTTRPLH
jgi:hypothetical protein